MLYLCYLCRFKPLRDYLRGFLIAAWAGDKIAEFSFPEISFHFPLRPWFFFVSPAYAGKRADCPTGGCSGGEKLKFMAALFSMWGSPPRMRGKEQMLQQAGRVWGITPACAGKRWCADLPAGFPRDHPRMCGEKHVDRIPPAAQIGSPPHVRGKALGPCAGRVAVGITPACAGKSPARPANHPARWDHPRMCGEKRQSGRARCSTFSAS